MLHQSCSFYAINGGPAAQRHVAIKSEVEAATPRRSNYYERRSPIELSGGRRAREEVDAVALVIDACAVGALPESFCRTTNSSPATLSLRLCARGFRSSSLLMLPFSVPRRGGGLGSCTAGGADPRLARLDAPANRLVCRKMSRSGPQHTHVFL
jgi:hypothetical protein